MAVDRARVAEVFAAGRVASRIGSGYAVGDRLVLTAAHVLTDAGLTRGDPAEVCLLGAGAWAPGSVTWLDRELDAALIEVAPAAAAWPTAGMAALRWGVLAGGEPVTAAAIGFPWAQERPDLVRDTDHVVGFVPPAAGVESGRLHLTVLSAAPAPRPGTESPWAGMSGAGLVIGPYLVGVIMVDPARYGTDRLVAVPVARLLQASGFREALNQSPEPVPVDTNWRLEYAAGRSLTLAAPYRPLPRNFNAAAARSRLLYPEHGVVPFSGRADLIRDLVEWCTGGASGLAVSTVTGAGGSGKTRLAAEVCLALAGHGWDAGFADPDRPGGTVRWQLDRPTLLVVDNADLNVILAADLITSLAYTDVPLRLLLLARSRATWWQQLSTVTESLVEGLDRGDLPLNAHALELEARATQYHAAFHSLTSALPGPDAPPSVAPAPPDLAVDAFGDPLMVHLAALLAASGQPLGQEIPNDGRQIRAAVLRTFLDREAQRWPKLLAAAEDRGEGEVVLRRCVAAAAISSPAAETPAQAMLATVPDLAEDSEGSRRRAVARWLHGLHPGLAYWNPLRPDPLADQLLADLDVLTELVNSVAERAVQLGDRPTMDRLLAELTRAAAAIGDKATAAAATQGTAATALGTC